MHTQTCALEGTHSHPPTESAQKVLEEEKCESVRSDFTLLSVIFPAQGCKRWVKHVRGGRREEWGGCQVVKGVLVEGGGGVREGTRFILKTSCSR